MGVYAIVCGPTGEQYVGASASLNARKRAHAGDLKNRRHPCQGLQALYNRYGYAEFRWFVLEEVASAESLTEAEERWMATIEFTQPGSLLNRRPTLFHSGKAVTPGRMVRIPEVFAVVLEEMANEHFNNLTEQVKIAIRQYLEINQRLPKPKP